MSVAFKTYGGAGGGGDVWERETDLLIVELSNGGINAAVQLSNCGVEEWMVGCGMYTTMLVTLLFVKNNSPLGAKVKMFSLLVQKK